SRFEAFYIAWFYPREVEQGGEGDGPEDFNAGGGGGGTGMRYLSELQGQQRPASDTDEASGGGSNQETLSMADFRFVFDREQQRELANWLDQLARRIKRRLVRRQRSAGRGRVLNFRKTTRSALAFGGEAMRLHFRRRQKRLPRLVILLDVSQSMDVYTKFFMRFAMGVSEAFQEADVYAFHTRLIHLGDVLREKKIDQLEKRLTALSRGWLGGTRIAASFAEFNTDYLHRTVHSRTIVLVFSDGFDTAASGELAEQVERMSARAKKVLWLHPLLARPGGPKLDPALKQSLPYIEALLPAHSLQALAELEPHLSR
ncbi:MAG: vWA domain-containing protein, partial [Granulosicoccaceae bacterium]